MLVINRLHQVLRPFLLRRLKSQVLSQLPEKTEHVVRCELSAWQRILYKQIQRYGAVATRPGLQGEKKPSRMTGLSNLIMQVSCRGYRGVLLVMLPSVGCFISVGATQFVGVGIHILLQFFLFIYWNNYPLPHFHPTFTLLRTAAAQSCKPPVPVSGR